MATIRYEAEDGILEFDHDDLMEKLTHYAKEKHVEEAIELIDIISPPTNDKITISDDFQFIVYVIFDLLMDGKGIVKCKQCDKTYIPRDLKSTGLGYGKNPFETNIAEEKKKAMKMFRKSQRLPGVFGEKCYTCPENHELITMITWRT